MKWCGGMVTEHCSSVETANVQSEMSHPALPHRLTPCHGLSHRARFASVPGINSIEISRCARRSPVGACLPSCSCKARCSGPAAVAGSPATVEPEQPAFATSRSGSPEQGPVGQGGTGQPAGRTTVADARRTSREPRGRRRAGAPAVRRADRGEQAGPVPPAQPAATGRWPGGRPGAHPQPPQSAQPGAAAPRRSPNCASTTAGRGSTRRCNGRYATIAWTNCTPSPCHGRRAICHWAAL